MKKLNKKIGLFKREYKGQYHKVKTIEDSAEEFRAEWYELQEECEYFNYDYK